MEPRVAAIQQHLEELYEVDPGYRAEHFLVSDPLALERLHPGQAHAPEEQLLLREDDEGIALSLYLSSGLLQRLQQDDPLCRLHEGNLADLCLAIEGVSHFLYLAWNARYDRPVSRLELELQAEVDKFVLSALLLDAQGQGMVPRGLHARLFRHWRIAKVLSHPERLRYHHANDYAAHYCTYLQRRLLRPRPGAALRDLRRFYRLHGQRKLRHIDGLARRH